MRWRLSAGAALALLALAAQPLAAQEPTRSEIIVLDRAGPATVPSESVALEEKPVDAAAEPASQTEPRGSEPLQAATAAAPASPSSQIIILDTPEPAEAPVVIRPADLAAPAAPPPPAVIVPALPDVVYDLRRQLPPVSREAMELALQGALAHARSADARRSAEAVAAFYAGREFAPLFVSHEGWGLAGQQVLARLARAGDDGLDLSTVALPAAPPMQDSGAKAQAELQLANAAIAYGRQASGGRVAPQRVSTLITRKPETAEPGAILAAVAGAADAGEALLSFHPPHAAYAALREKLKELRQERQLASRSRPEPIPDGPVLRVGMTDTRVPLIRARFGIDAAADAAGGELVYDTRVASAVADFQRAHGLEASGRLTPRTIAALSGGDPDRLEADILANMEMWRWMPRDMGEKRIVVNIPEFRVRVMQGDNVAHETRVIVGKPQTQTPVFSHAMQFAVVNPSWYVPPSILRKEKLPKLAQDPDYWTKRGYVVTRTANYISIRQPPGEKNALGQIKFMFPNEHSVYLHDTPSRGLFARDMRAFSHGCVRVEKPFAFGEAIMPGWSEERLMKLRGPAERRVNMPERVPVHLAYFTAQVDESGKLRLFDDLYGHTGKVKAALGLKD